MHRRRTLIALFCTVAFSLTLAVGSASASWYTDSNPISRSQLTAVPFDFRSFWLQPWRSSLKTRPATELANAIGINVDNRVSWGEAPDLMRLLHDSGFKRARLEIGWDQMSYSDPSRLANPAMFTSYISAMRANGIRPLILLNSCACSPAPFTKGNLILTSPAAAGATSVQLSSSSVSLVTVGSTGFAQSGTYVLITSVSPSGVATLSRPLVTALPAGSTPVSTLRYLPFSPPRLADGSRNPRYQQSLAGWLTYVKGVADFVRGVYGSDNFDVEVWNEAWPFLTESNYYSPVPDPGATGNVPDALLKATVALLKDPANGLRGVQIGDGFSNEIPWPSGATVPAGIAALDKHPYPLPLTFPSAKVDNPGIRPVGATGAISEKPMGHGSSVTWGDLFVPHYRVFMPEYYLTGIQTETLVHDLSPITTTINGTRHGAGTHPVGGAAPSMWITEDGMNATEAKQNGMPAADVPEMHAKSALRLLTAYASEGATNIDLWAANGGSDWQLIPQRFFDAVNANASAYPTGLGGPVMAAVGRLAASLSGAQPIAHPRQLTLNAIASDNNSDVQFTGNGTTSHPSLYNRDVLAFFPFQVSANKFVSSVYVMSSDVTHKYTNTPAAGHTPYDMPPENFQVTIGNLNAAHATVSLKDPLTGTTQPATIISRTTNQIVVQLQATDSPRQLTITDGGGRSTR